MLEIEFGRPELIVDSKIEKVRNVITRTFVILCSTLNRTFLFVS